MNVLDAALGETWAMQTPALEKLLKIAAREHEVTPEVLEKYRAENMRGEALEKRGSVAILNVLGPLFQRANLFTDVSGATSYDILRRDLQVALDDQDIEAILLNIDSPGGAAHGCGELAKAIHAAEKPVTAYVCGMAASGGYWIASAADRIVIDDMANVGSIGVVLGLTDTSARDAASGVRHFEFVSSQSPKKRIDPGSEEGASDLQRLADDMAEVFVAAVAEYRGTDAETVERDFGEGSVLVGAKAVAAGMADAVGTFEGTLETLAGATLPGVPAFGHRRNEARDGRAARVASSKPGGSTMADERPAGKQPASKTTDLEEARREAVANYRELRRSVMDLDAAQGREPLAEFLVDMGLSLDDAKAGLEAAASCSAEGQRDEDPEAAYERHRLQGVGLGGEASSTRPASKLDPAAVYAKRREG